MVKLAIIFVGLVMLGCILKQHLEIRRLTRERKKMLVSRKHGERSVTELRNDLFGAVNERDIFRCRLERAQAELKKSEDMCERLWKSNAELSRGCVVRK